MATCSTCQRSYTEGERFCPFDATQLAEDDVRETVVDDPLAGTVLDERFKLVRLIGSGGMGRVYEAEHVRIMRRVAIKVLRDTEAENPEMVQRFRQEAMSASKIGHPGIVQVLDFGTAPTGALYMVMELLRGADLSQLLAEQGPLSVERVVTLLVSACEALEAAHHAGIVHRDLKPENLFLTTDENGRELVKVLDFGLAKMSDLERPRGSGQRLTKTGMIFGTPKYMSPEQARGRPAEPRSDVYAMGIIAYELLTGKPPFEGSTFLGVLAAHLSDAPASIVAKRADVPPALEQAIFAALAKDASGRPASMATFANMLLGAIGRPARVSVRPLPSRLSESAHHFALVHGETTPYTALVSPPAQAFPSVRPGDPALLATDPQSASRLPQAPTETPSQRLKLSKTDVDGAPRRKASPLEGALLPVGIAVLVAVVTIVLYAVSR